ncbi:MAG: UDP-N-acetylmuramoyl-L-alanine--D-glutamate ligase [SAR116 cluster bacterium]|nr:UDP-N-acetylmuramoyl-L-alanine--D-glutamate ligase [SAR116 cluster bacterium]
MKKNIAYYKDKYVGILGAGKSGLAAAKILINSNANIFVFDDHYPRPLSIKKSNWKNYKLWPWKNLISIVVSPSIPTNNRLKHEAIELAIKHKVKIINEIDLFFETQPTAKIVGITGTNGKSTTVSLLHHILNLNKIRCEIGGNFGYPACLINDPGHEGVIILELSSYQLDGIKKLKLDIASIINISPDHIDFHETFDKYISSKLKILSCLNINGVLVFNKSDEFLKEIIQSQKNTSIKLLEADESSVDEFINDNNYLKGTHNSINTSIAITIAKRLNIQESQIKSAIESFVGLPHRMEPIYVSKKFTIINDSKSTNGESTSAALSSFDNIFWIAGGEPKSDGIGQAKKYLKKVNEVFLIGKSTNYFENEIIKHAPKLKVSISFTLDKAIQDAIECANRSKLNDCIILFSPSAASFDQFKNYEDRGNYLKKIIKQKLDVGVAS